MIGGPAVVDGPVGLVQRLQVVAAEVADRAGQGSVVQVGHELGQGLVPAGQALAELVRVAAEQPLVLGVGHGVDPVPQRLPARPGEQLVEQPPVLQRDDLPARRAEHAAQPVGGDQRDHPVQRLAVHVDDPDDLAEFGHAGVDDGLPDRALVELGVAEQRVLAAGGAVADEPVQVPARHRAPDRGGRADADRPGGVVDRVGVLDPARVALQAAERPQRRQVRLVELAEQVVDRVQHGRGVRLDRHPVVGAQVPEPQRGHDRDHRGATTPGARRPSARRGWAGPGSRGGRSPWTARAPGARSRPVRPGWWPSAAARSWVHDNTAAARAQPGVRHTTGSQ